MPERGTDMIKKRHLWLYYFLPLGVGLGGLIVLSLGAFADFGPGSWSGLKKGIVFLSVVMYCIAGIRIRSVFWGSEKPAVAEYPIIGILLISGIVTDVLVTFMMK